MQENLLSRKVISLDLHFLSLSDSSSENLLDEANPEVQKPVGRKAVVVIWVTNDGHLDLGNYSKNGDK